LDRNTAFLEVPHPHFARIREQALTIGRVADRIEKEIDKVIELYRGVEDAPIRLSVREVRWHTDALTLHTNAPEVDETRRQA